MRRILPLLLTLVLLLPSCAGQNSPPPTAEAVLSAMATTMTRTAQPLPDGLLYSRAVAANAPQYLTEAFFTALYGRAAEGLLGAPDAQGAAPPVGDAAMLLSVAPYPCELAVFRCSDTDAVPTVVSLCRGRLDTVSRGFAGSEWESAAKGLVVTEGCFVLLVIAEDPQAVVEGARAALGRRG